MTRIWVVRLINLSDIGDAIQLNSVIWILPGKKTWYWMQISLNAGLLKSPLTRAAREVWPSTPRWMANVCLQIALHSITKRKTKSRQQTVQAYPIATQGWNCLFIISITPRPWKMIFIIWEKRECLFLLCFDDLVCNEVSLRLFFYPSPITVKTVQ